jgi:phage tail tape-measure protein
MIFTQANLFPQFRSPQGGNPGLSQLKYFTNSSYGKRICKNTSAGYRSFNAWRTTKIVQASFIFFFIGNKEIALKASGTSKHIGSIQKGQQNRKKTKKKRKTPSKTPRQKKPQKPPLQKPNVHKET